MKTYLHVPQHLGWGGDVTVLTTCTHGGCSATHGVGGWCYRSCNLHTWWMFRNNWGGGVMLPFLQLAHMVDVTQHMGWGVMLPFLQLAHMVDVPQHMGWGGDVTVLATCTHGRCYATTGVLGWCYRSYNLHAWWMFRNTWGGGVMLPFLQLFVVHASERLICCFPSSIGIHEPSFKNTRLQKAVLPCFYVQKRGAGPVRLFLCLNVSVCLFFSHALSVYKKFLCLTRWAKKQLIITTSQARMSQFGTRREAHLFGPCLSQKSVMTKMSYDIYE